MKRFFRVKFLFFYIPLAILLYAYGHVFLYSIHPTLPSHNSPPVLYSNQCGSDLRLTLLKAIKSSKEKIHLVMFGLTEPSILRNLAKKSVDDCVRTDIYYDPSASLQLTNQIKRLRAHPIYSGGLMHQKILVVDNELVFLGSANMTRSSMTMHDNIVLGFYSPKIAKFLMEKTPHSSGHLKTMVGGQDVEIWLLPDARGHALSAMKNALRRAVRSIKVAMFTLTHPTLIEELIAAKKSGVRVQVAIDYHTKIGASASSIQKLKEADVEVIVSQGPQLMHHKFLLVDDNILILGSANWTKAAFYNNHDCFVILNNITEEQRVFMKNLWDKIEYE